MTIKRLRGIPIPCPDCGQDCRAVHTNGTTLVPKELRSESIVWCKCQACGVSFKAIRRVEIEIPSMEVAD